MSRRVNLQISCLSFDVCHLSFDIGYCLLFIIHCSLFICSLFIVLSACARPDDTWDRVRETGVLRVGMDASFPPFETIAADGALAGFDVDLARELGRRLGVEIQFVANLPYDGLYDALAVDRVDVVISALVVNPARMADFAYSASYFDAGQVLVVRPPSVPPASGGEDKGVPPARGGEDKGVPPARGGEDKGVPPARGGEPPLPSPPLAGGSPPFCPSRERGGERGGGGVEEMADLSGRTLAVEFGTQGDLEARKWARRLPDLTIAPYQTAAEALASVAAGEADGALVDHVSALAATACLRSPKPGTGGGLVIVGKPLVEEPYAVAVQRESRHLLQAINEALAEMEADGTMEALIERWMCTIL